MPRGKPVPRPVSVYALLDPVTLKPRYVGHSTRLADRVGIHWCTRHSDRYLPVRAWLASLDEPPPYVVLAADVPFEARYEAEAAWTERLLAEGEDLLNVSIGAKISPQVAASTNAARRRHLAAKRLRERGRRPTRAPRPRLSPEARRQRYVEASRRRRERERLASDAAIVASGVRPPTAATAKTRWALVAAQTEAVAQLLTAISPVRPVREAVATWLGVPGYTATRRLDAARQLLAERETTSEAREVAA
ncbi:hypothetical protein ABT255_42355 [Streptomyces mirabilis]|uniref:hypothetical protein n=1 Tax=Streptomyces mirabilis TaxID=68239 RepID=UPI00332001F1